jgi:flagellar basal body-associated protein FliL
MERQGNDDSSSLRVRPKSIWMSLMVVVVLVIVVVLSLVLIEDSSENDTSSSQRRTTNLRPMSLPWRQQHRRPSFNCANRRSGFGPS